MYVKVIRSACIYFLTAVHFIGPVPAVIVCVTEPVCWDTVAIGTGVLVGWAGGGTMGGTVLFITRIETVIVPITVPATGDTLTTSTGKGSWGAGSVWKGEINQPLVSVTIQSVTLVNSFKIDSIVNETKSNSITF